MSEKPFIEKKITKFESIVETKKTLLNSRRTAILNQHGGVLGLEKTFSSSPTLKKEPESVERLTRLSNL